MKDIKHIRGDFFFSRLGHARGMGLGGYRGAEGFNLFSKIQPDLDINGTCNGTIFGFPPPGPWGGPKYKISFNPNHKVNFKDFKFKLIVSSHK